MVVDLMLHMLVTATIMCVHTTGPPGIPMNIRYNHVTSASFVVQWDEVDDADHYLVNWRSGGSKAREAATSQTSHTITGLAPNTTYYVTVIAVNGYGQSNTSSSIVTTNEIEPSSPITTNEIELSSTVTSITTIPAGNLIVHICESKYHEVFNLSSPYRQCLHSPILDTTQ